MSVQEEVYKKQLIERYLAGRATEGELMAFFGLLDRNQIDELIESYMDEEILAIRAEEESNRENYRSVGEDTPQRLPSLSVLACSAAGSC